MPASALATATPLPHLMADAALGLPEATVRTRFFRARCLLREGLAREVDGALADAFSFDGARCDRIVAAVMARLGDRADAAGS